VFNKTKIAMCVAILIGTASAGLAKDQYTQKDQVRASQKSDRSYSFAQAPGKRQGKCWVPTPDDSGDYGADSRGLGYWGSCSEKGAVPSR
jgi:hypothetical protein